MPLALHEHTGELPARRGPLAIPEAENVLPEGYRNLNAAAGSFRAEISSISRGVLLGNGSP